MNQVITNTIPAWSNKFYSILIPVAILSFFIFDFNIYYAIATAIFLHQFLSLYFSLGEKIPIRYLAGTMFSLNFLFSPVLMYFWLNPYIDPDYSMRGDPSTYFIYAIPCMLLFIICLNIKRTDEEEILDVESIRKIIDRYPYLPLQLIIIGIVAGLASPYFPSDFSFIAGSISYFRFVGFFLSILSGKRFNFLYFMASYGMLIILSLTESMFNDLLNMLFFLSFFLGIRYKPTTSIKLLGVALGIGLVVLIQIIKLPLREMTTNSFSDLKNINVALEKGASDNSKKSLEEKTGDVVFRIGQGWVTSSTIEYYELGNFKLQNGSHSVEIVKTAITPRLLDANRILVGDATWFNRYSGMQINSLTSIALGILSDAFIDFGYYGFFIVGIFGGILNLFIKLFHKMDKRYPLAKVFLPICFFYLRPDADTYATLGALIKTTFIAWLFLFFFHTYFLKKEIPAEELNLQ